MDFEWDPPKSQKTWESWGISFEDVTGICSDPESIEVQARCAGELRWAKIGQVGGQILTAIFTMRSGRIRIISVRRAHKSEVYYYGKVQKEDEHSGFRREI